jgi:hypothetical protein
VSQTSSIGEEYVSTNRRRSDRNSIRNNISNRLRKRDLDTPVHIPVHIPVHTHVHTPVHTPVHTKTLPREVRETRSMTKTNGHPEEGQLSRRLHANKRELKSIQKSTNNDSESDESHYSKQNEYTNRNQYFHRYGSIYQEYDDFLKKRKKNKRIEFIPRYSDPNEEAIESINSKDLIKYKGPSTVSQDTF